MSNTTPKTLFAENLRDQDRVKHGFFTSEWGDCGLVSADQVTDNRKRVAESLGVSGENLLSCFQTHSPDVVTVTKPWSIPDRPHADGMVTNVPGLALGILTADCVPIIFFDPRAAVIGACHAGWRGALNGVIENTLTAMEKLGAERRSVFAAIGPCIWQSSYEVGPEFPAPFLAENPDHVRFFRPAFRSDHYMFNLPAYVQAKVEQLGLLNVAPSMADTAADERHFFSYRRSTLRGEKRAGSLISVIVL